MRRQRKRRRLRTHPRRRRIQRAAAPAARPDLPLAGATLRRFVGGLGPMACPAPRRPGRSAGGVAGRS